MYDWHSLLILQEKLVFTDMLYMPDGINASMSSCTKIHRSLMKAYASCISFGSLL